ncbi:hypothetical protein C5B42_03935 [Candidatus Cerribacteria bacterium 'Amazon FNV 2010 28 9']|uniref:Uncharacterized protein n=1 Tax=Candidatus Cerribacteria bacterium 'Amazon FNV 2010 28 9' TaxID=2081795 RepID=A0A317JNM8_9BACT|nr:MAG: hypothetical protein C5B42_03935 [Candidatus Cerribacteria bacterium 'Amazon FNV 2010 28 9']
MTDNEAAALVYVQQRTGELFASPQELWEEIEHVASLPVYAVLLEQVRFLAEATRNFKQMGRMMEHFASYDFMSLVEAYEEIGSFLVQQLEAANQTRE